MRSVRCAALLLSLAGLTAAQFPEGLVSFDQGSSVFSSSGGSRWDAAIRERGFVMYEDGAYHLFYSGYNTPDSIVRLGYATSPDGREWTRHPANPLLENTWVEDMTIVKHDGAYYMMAEGVHDWAHLLTSTDRVRWTDHGSILIREPGGTPICDSTDNNCHAGTPALWRENGTWYLFFERDDQAIWLATTKEETPLDFTKVQSAPVLSPGPEPYDKVAIACDQIIKHNGKYYMYYHATAHDPWDDWCYSIAVSDDLIHWTKYGNNPLSYDGDAPILVDNGRELTLFVTESGRAASCMRRFSSKGPYISIMTPTRPASMSGAGRVD